MMTVKETFTEMHIGESRVIVEFDNNVYCPINFDDIMRVEKYRDKEKNTWEIIIHSTRNTYYGKSSEDIVKSCYYRLQNIILGGCNDE